jgi:hypothetical protein
MPRYFETPADLAGRVKPGDLLQDANGRLLLVDRPVDPRDFHEHQRPAVAGQHTLHLFGTEIDYTPGHDDSADVRWPLRRVRVVDDDRGNEEPPDRSNLCACLGLCLATGRCPYLDPADDPAGATGDSR